MELETSELTGEFSAHEGLDMQDDGEQWVAGMPVRFLVGAAVWMGKPREGEVGRKMF